MKIAHVILLVLALAACRQQTEEAPQAPAAESQAPDPADLHIEIGRYGVMLNQVHDLTFERPGAAEADPVQPRELGRALREAVWEYNLERSRLCGKGLFTDVACGPAYEPVWISEPSNVEPTLVEVQSRSQALGEEVMRFWSAVCDDARSRVQDQQERMTVCAIE
jgi:hypothetical protein